MRALSPVQDQWKNLGALLGCDEGTLNSVEAKGRDCTLSCLRELIYVFLKNIDPPLSWKLVIEAVKVFYPSQAQIIAMPYT